MKEHTTTTTTTTMFSALSEFNKIFKNVADERLLQNLDDAKTKLSVQRMIGPTRDDLLKGLRCDELSRYKATISHCGSTTLTGPLHARSTRLHARRIYRGAIP